MYNCSYVCSVALYNVHNFCIHSYLYVFFKPTFNAPPLIHPVAFLTTNLTRFGASWHHPQGVLS